MEWDPWTECLQDEQVFNSQTFEFYYKLKRSRTRKCNTGDDKCMTEPGLIKSDYEEQYCGTRCNILNFINSYIMKRGFLGQKKSILIILFSVHWQQWETWSGYKQIGSVASGTTAPTWDQRKSANCFKGERRRTRVCNDDPTYHNPDSGCTVVNGVGAEETQIHDETTTDALLSCSKLPFIIKIA